MPNIYIGYLLDGSPLPYYTGPCRGETGPRWLVTARCVDICSVQHLGVDICSVQHLGEVSVPDGGYRLAPGTDLAPDVGFVRAERLPPLDSPNSDKLIPGAPDLAVEI